YNLIVCLFVVACSHEANEEHESKPEPKSVAEPLVPDVGDGWLSFELQGPEPGQSGDATIFLAAFRTEGKVARFDFELNTKPPSADGLGFGRFIAVPGSDSSVLLRNLKTTLAAKKPPIGVVRVKELPFAFILLGNDMSHARDGGMFAEPRGHW